MTPKILYADLDGTLLGPGGSLFATRNGPTLSAAEAIARLAEHGVRLVLVSGRTRDQLHEIARLLGATAYIAELGAIIVVRGSPDEVHRDFGSFEGPGGPFKEMVRSGAGAFLLERYSGSLELHTPWALQPREATMLFRGFLDLTDANAALENADYTWLTLHDNGIIRREFPSLDVPEVHAYHLAPKGVSKAAAVRRHLEIERASPANSAAVGDSMSDLELAPEVGRLFLVANAGPGPAAALPSNARMLAGEFGEGFAEAVREFLDSE